MRKTSNRLDKCPQCSAPVIQTNLGGGRTDDYCEECGWPDENRPETMVPREESEALAKVCEGILNGTETIISMRDAFIAYRAKHSAPDAGKEVKPPKSKEDIRHVIKDFWQERYGSVHQRMNERTEEEIKELAKRIHSLIYEQ